MAGSRGSPPGRDPGRRCDRLQAQSAYRRGSHHARPKLDDMVLLVAFQSPAFYVGALGSHVNSERRKERLAEHFDLSREQLERL
ncbi:XdhC family protein [Massilia sp.]|uniref:XdhC family protein n=1 Tax=Massilia sp. TaxID=1882437 RepID=UPI003917E802